MNIKNLKINLDNKILKSNKVIIVPHIRPDFDAISSAIGVSLIANNFNKKSFVINDDKANMDEHVSLMMDSQKNNFNFLTCNEYESLKKDDDLLILTDVNDSNLISLNNISNAENTIIIDHHNSSKSCVNSNYKFIDSKISSAAEIVFELLQIYNINLDSQIASYLLAGIYLDTNKLTRNVTSATMRSVANLIDSGADLNFVVNLFNDNFDIDRKIQNLINNTEFLNRVGLVLGDDTQIYTREELAKAADYILKFDIDASYAIGRVADDIISISARSKANYNVGKIMLAMSGGGNEFSAATKIKNTSVGETYKKLIKLIK